MSRDISHLELVSYESSSLDTREPILDNVLGKATAQPLQNIVMLTGLGVTPAFAGVLVSQHQNPS
jgi:hypothetical protein